MNTRTLSAGLAGVGLISLALGCERGNPASTMLASRPAGPSPNFSASAGNHHMRWDIISVNFGTGTVSAGGVASALANDNSKITLTSTGTFRSNPGNPQDVTGGGGGAPPPSRRPVGRNGTPQGPRLGGARPPPPPRSSSPAQTWEPPHRPAR